MPFTRFNPLVRACLGLVVALSAAHLAHAQPQNNICGQNQASFTIPGAGGTVNGSLQFATNDGGSTCTGAGGPDVYYYFTPAVTGLHRFSTCGSPTNTILSLHTACPANGVNMQMCNDDASGCSGASQFDFNVTAGTPYVIRVGGFTGTSIYTFTLAVNPNPVRPCCLPNGSCVTTFSLNCTGQGGVVQPGGTACSPNPCPQPGVCCNTFVGGCSITLPANCAGTFIGSGTCSPDPCIGRCCIAGCCTSTYRQDCSSANWVVLASCSPNPCPAPTNDHCTGAHTIAPTSLPVTIHASNCNATDDIGDWCAAQGASNSHNNIWYSFTPATTANYDIGTCGSEVADTVLAIYTSPDCVNFTPIACLDDQSTSFGWSCTPSSALQSRFLFTLTAGVRYYLHIGSWSSTTPVTGGLTLSLSSPAIAGACCQSLSGACVVAAGDPVCPASFNYMGDGSVCTITTCDGPANDFCTDAEPVCLESLVSGTTINARNEGAASCDSSTSLSPDCWYAYVPAQSGRVSFTVQGSGGFDAIVSVWTGTCPGTTEVACADQFGNPSAVGTFDVTAGVRYLLRISGFANARGPFQLYLDDFLGTPGCGNIPGNGACCPGDNSCSVTTQAACGGQWTAAGTCTPNPCPQLPGACCTSGVCTFTTPASCAGAFQGVGVSCSPTPCIGSCCLVGACSPITIDRASCTGTWTNCTQNCGCGTPPANDSCPAASLISVNQTVNGDTCAATSDWPGCFGTPPPHTVWYAFTPAATRSFVFDLCGSTTDPALLLLAGNCNGSPITCGTSDASGDGTCTDRTSFTPPTPLNAGITYYIGVYAYGPDGHPTGPGAFTLSTRMVVTGACCHIPSSTCEIKTAAGCGFGAPQPSDFQFLGEGRPCSPQNSCLDRGACCTSPTTCELRYQLLCTFPDLYNGQGSTCQPVSPCSSIGACCESSGVCFLRLASQCISGRVFMGEGTLCAAVTCPPLGACCTSPSSSGCSMMTHAGCDALSNGVWFGAASTCTTTDCSVMGACCFSNTCLPGAPSICRSVGGIGAFQGFGVPCTPSPCAGACCTGTSCTTTSSSACTGTFQGTNTACGPANNPTTCCPANFNQQGGISVQDIFDFLAAYFSNQPSADFNHSGVLSVQDIFDFLAAYFAGCA